ncbi:hypothetical protein V6Z11_D02G035800 [Gossypium hirsutum]
MNALMKLLILAPCCFFFIALIKLLYDYLWIPLRIQHMLNSQGIKGPPYRFIHGNNMEVTKMKQNALSKSVALTDDLFPKNMTPAIIASVETMLEKWKGQEGKEIEVYQEFRLLTSEVISRTAFGSNYMEGEKIFAIVRKLTVIMSRNLSKTRIPLISKLWKSADLLESEKLSKEMKDRVMKIVKKREDKVVNGEVNSFRSDFLGLLLNAYHDSDAKNRLSLEDVVAECKTLYFAGQETVNSLLAWIVLHLAILGDWQEKARRELVDIFGNQNPHLEGIAKLKIMTMIINEALRLYGPTNVLQRTGTREIQLGKLILPGNIDILPLSIGLHRDPHFWGNDVHHFKPERFAEGIAKATNYTAAAFFPFGLGPRSCVGMTFAMIETKIALSMILQRYTITLSPAYVHSPVLILTLQPQNGIQVILEPIHSNA